MLESVAAAMELSKGLEVLIGRSSAADSVECVDWGVGFRYGLLLLTVLVIWSDSVSPGQLVENAVYCEVDLLVDVDCVGISVTGMLALDGCDWYAEASGKSSDV